MSREQRIIDRQKEITSKKLTFWIAGISLFSLSFSIVLWIILAEEAGTPWGNFLRYYTYQSNVIVCIAYFLMLLSFFVKPMKNVKDNRRFRYLINIWISLTFWVVIFILGPLQILNVAFEIGPGAFGNPPGKFPVYDGVYKYLYMFNEQWSNLFFHLLIPVLVIYHYFYDRKWLNRDWYITHRAVWVGLFYPFVYFVISVSLYYYDGWMPYSVINPEMWISGWKAVFGWILYGISLYFVFAYIYKWLDNKRIQRI